MAKSKNKPLKQYKVPREKFLVVVDAWGLIGDFVQSDFNQISAWFELMLEEAYPNMRVSSIYYQRTHRNIIVELPREVEDTNQYLGAHFYSKFLTHDTDSYRKVLIYEYKYATFGDPGERNWSVGYPNYTRIPPDIPIKRPFPLLPFPPPLPTTDIPYARQVPVDVVAANEGRHVLQALLKTAEATPPCSSSKSDPCTSFESSQPRNNESLNIPLSPHASDALRPSSNRRSNHPDTPHVQDEGESSTAVEVPPPTGTFTPYPPPSYVTSHPKQSIPHNLPFAAAQSDQITKRDPYEEDEESRNILRSPQFVKAEEADDFLSSLLSIKKEKGTYIKPEDEDDYQPSAELLAALNTLPPELLNVKMELDEEESKPQVNLEPIKQEIGDYHPSDELMAALAELPPALRPEHVKSEVDDYQPSNELLAEFLRSSTDDAPVKSEQDAPDEREFTPKVKEEPMEGVLPHTLHRSGQSSSTSRLPDSRNPSATQSHVQVKSEPMDNRYGLKYFPPPNRFVPRQVDYDASRDPRLKLVDMQRKNSGDKRDGSHLSRLHANTSKRIKREYIED